MVDLARYGTKHVCFSCACKFYDLNRPVAVCPKCGSDQANAPKVSAAPKKVARQRVIEEPDFDTDDTDEAAALDPEEFPTLDDTEEFEDDLSEEATAASYGD